MGILAGLLAWGVVALAGALGPIQNLSEPALIDLAFLDEGRTLLVASGEGLEVWDVEEGRRLRLRPRLNITSLAVNPGRTAVAVGVEWGVEVWDPVLFAPVQRLSHPRYGAPKSVALSPSGRIVVGNFGLGLVLWRALTGEVLVHRTDQELLGDHRTFDATLFLSEEELVIAAYPDLYLWDFSVQRLRKLGELAFRVSQVAVDSRRRWVGFPAGEPGASFAMLKIVDVDGEREIIRVPFHGGAADWTGFTPDGRVLVPSRTRLGYGLHLFRTDTPDPLCLVVPFSEEPPSRVAVSRDGTRLAVVEHPAPFLIRIAAYRLDQCRLLAVLGRWTPETRALAISRDGRWLARAGPLGVEIRSLPDGVLHRTLELRPNVEALAVSPVGPVVAVAAWFGSQIVVWDWEAGKRIMLDLHLPDPQEAFAHRARRLEFTPDGTKLVVAHLGGGISVWDFVARKRLWLEDRRRQPAWPVVSGDGRLLITIGADGITIRDLLTGKLLDEGPGEVSVRGVFPLEEGVLVINALVGRVWMGSPRLWHVLRFSPAGKILQFESLKAPGGLGVLLGDRRTLAVLGEVARPTPDLPEGSLFLWDVREDREVHRWAVDFVPLRTFGVAAVPGARRVVIWNPTSSVRLYSVNLPPADLVLRVPAAFVVGEAVQICAEAVDPEGGPLVFYWDLGDGTMAQGPCVLHTYTREDRYTLRVMAADDAGDVIALAREIRVARVRLDFVWLPRDPGVLEELIFRDVSHPADLVASVRWEFGDGREAEGLVVPHRYARPGTYVVRARVQLKDGQSKLVERTITVADVSCVEEVPKPGAPRFYRIRLAPADLAKARFGESVWILRRRPGAEDGWFTVARAVVFTPQAEGAWVVLAEAFSGLEPWVGDRVVFTKP